MIYTPKKKPEKFDLLMFIMDNLLYFILGALVAFCCPYFFTFAVPETTVLSGSESIYGEREAKYQL